MASEIFILVPIVPFDGRCSALVRQGHAEQTAALVELFLPIAVAQETVVANALEPVRQHMEQKPADKFVGGQGHRFVLAAMAIILPLEADLIVLDIEEAVVGDGHAVGVAAHVVEDLLRSSEWALGIDHPFGSFGAGQELGESESFAKRFQGGEELQFTGIECLLQGFQEEAAE
jgi:hypothetical protein